MSSESKIDLQKAHLYASKFFEENVITKNGSVDLDICNWGWGGSDNGFFSGEVFKAGGFQFVNRKYFTIKNEN